MKSRFSSDLIVGLTLPLYLFAPAGFAQESVDSYPKKQIRLILPQTPGAATDVLARAIGRKLAEAWGQAVVVDNRAGASGNIGTELAAKSAPDGYTLLFGAVGMMAINPILYKKVPFDVKKDFSPVALLATVPVVVIGHPSLPVNTIKDLIQLAKSKPGQLSHGSAGNGTPGHLIMEALKQSAKIDMVHVPYKGAAPALNALLGAEVQVITTGVGSAIALINAGKVKPLGIANRERLAIVPDIPTMAEAGLAGVDDLLNWYALFAPAGTPRGIISKLNREVVRIVQSPSLKEIFYRLGYETSTSTPAQFTTYFHNQIKRWDEVIKASKATVD